MENVVNGYVVRAKDNKTVKTSDENSKVVAIPDFIEKLPGYSAQNLTLDGMIYFLIVIAAFIIGIFIFVMTLQKTAMFGVLKVQGVPTSYLAKSVLLQTLVLALIGVGIGLALTAVTVAFLPESMPYATNYNRMGVFSILLIVSAIVGGAFSIRTIAKIDPLIAIGGIKKMTNVLELSNVSKKYGSDHTEVIALKELSFAVKAGEFVAVIGPSGSGKSTFLTIAAGLQKPTNGDVLVGNQSLNNLSKKQLLDLRFKKIGFILQSSNLVPFLKVEDQFHLIEKVDKSRRNEEKKIELLKTLGIYDLKDKYPRDLSGGERQRVAIACALYHEPDVILADEPTASLDTEKAFDVVKLLGQEAKDKNKGIVMVTHDERLLEYCDRVVRIRDGELEELN